MVVKDHHTAGANGVDHHRVQGRVVVEFLIKHANAEMLSKYCFFKSLFHQIKLNLKRNGIFSVRMVHHDVWAETKSFSLAIHRYDDIFVLKV